MVTQQIMGRGVVTPRVIEAFRKVSRHLFIPEQFRSHAYNDHPLPIGEGQTISQPYMVALMTDLLDLTEEDKVLEIGTGSGYQAAILAELAKEVYTIERHRALAERAKRILQELDYKNVKVLVGDGTKGRKEFSPYQKIIVTASAPGVPQPLFEQLDEMGKLVIPVGGRWSQDLVLIQKKKGEMISKPVCGCVFVPLIGEYGYGGSD
ncbi:protein-L-isoaspartate(D-aspartate) O-methyltransferase [bacterium]|nr:protein-L-isoaspartate(D-aspartate) O-methyltransferase [bacterium]NIO19036.1 protein-L-isoaspartate(D-aspartate) O-methyltransferase [bacterium]NIO74165.1 protein-L-isoaspartate(D-aspartate) O-methyltransferase [bacterium]